MQSKRILTLTKQIPALGKIPFEQRLFIFNQAFKSTAYKIFLALIFVAFILVIYINLEVILAYRGLERGGLIARSVHFLKELGIRFFIPLMMVMLAMVLGRNFFVRKEVEKYLRDNNYLN